MMDLGHRWRPIEQPADPRSLALDEMRAFATFWQGQKSRLARHGALARFEERMRRWWAIETGILERIYDLSLGATRLFVEHGFVASLLTHGESSLPPEQLVEILHDQRQGLDMVMDVVGGVRSLSVSWIKELHALLTRHQETVTARTSLGQLIEVPLERGAFKRSPNNPERPDGIVHEYCPPEHVAAEMDRLVDLYDKLPADLPEVRAAWLHHAFTQIHPFQDGNGRVARALASIDFVKAGLFPVLIERDDKPVYIKALETADAGDLCPLIALFGQAETRVITRAISEAEGALDDTATLTDIRQAVEHKLATRRQAAGSVRDDMLRRFGGFMATCQRQFENACQSLQEGLPSIRCTVGSSSSSTQHYYRHQIIELAQRHGYWADLREHRRWALLKLQDGGIVDIVVTLHFIGNPSTGAAVANIFMDHRDAGEEMGIETQVLLPVEPLRLVPDEIEEKQARKFDEWLATALRHALAQWTRYL